MTDREALLESSRKIRALFDQTFQFIGLMTMDGTLIEANRAALEFAGIETSSVLNKPFWETPWWTHSPELQKRLREAVKRAAGGEFVRFEATHPGKDGTLHDIDFSLKPVRDETGKIIYLIPEGRDISELKRLKNNLQDSESKFRGLFDNIQAVVAVFKYIFDENGQVINAEVIDGNPLAWKGMGAGSLADILHKKLDQLFGPENLVLKLPVLRQMRESRKVIQSESYYPSLGRTYLTTLFPLDSETFLSSGVDITDRKNAEYHLRESEEKFRALAENSLDVIMRFDLRKRYQYVNPAVEVHFGIPAKKFLGKTAADLGFPKDLVDLWERAILQTIDSREVQHAEYELPDRTWMDWILIPEFGPDGSVCGVMTSSRDITQLKGLARTLQRTMEQLEARVAERTRELSEANRSLRQENVNRRRIEKMLIESEKRLSAIADNLPDGMIYQVVTDKNGKRKCTYLSGNICSLHGCSAEEVFEDINHFYETFHEDDLPRVKAEEEQAIATMSVFRTEARVRRLSGEFGWSLIMSQPRLLEDGSICWDGFEQDITERKRLEEDRDQIVNLSHDLICIAGMDGYFQFVNPAWTKVLGYADDELLSRPFLDFIHPGDHHKNDEEMKSLISGKTTIDFENRYFHKDGSIRHFLWAATPLPEKGLLYCIGRDITDRKRSEEELLRARNTLEERVKERTKELEHQTTRLRNLAIELTQSEERERRLLAEMLHDELQQHLVDVQLRASMVENPKDSQDLLELIAQCIRTSRSVTSELSPPILNDGELPVALEGLARLYRDKYSLEVALRIDRSADPETAEGRSILYRGARELLMNIYKHARVSKAMLTLSRDGDDIRLQAEDMGVGFDKKEYDSRENSGFGLFNLQERLEPLGGRIEVDSAPGQGTRIALVLPDRSRI